jgi:hypothetical protein
MKSLCLGLAATLAVAGSTALAAEITHVASSGDPDHPFGADFWLGFEYLNHTGVITREAGACPWCTQLTTTQIPQLNYQQSEQSMPMRVAIGLWKDIEVHASTSIVFADNDSWGFYPGQTAINSTITNNCWDKRFGNGNNGLLSAACPAALKAGGGMMAPASNTGVNPIFQVDPNGDTGYHGGLDNFVFGLAWAVMNDKRDDTKPTLVFGFDYTFPNATPIDPYNAGTPGPNGTCTPSPGGSGCWVTPNKASNGDNAPSSTGPIGDKVQKFDLWLAMSKRLGRMDPYVKVFAEIPHQAPGYYTNCDNYFQSDPNSYQNMATVQPLPGNFNNGNNAITSPAPFGSPSGLNERFVSYPENCGYGPWTRSYTGIQDPYIGGFLVGTEFNAYDDSEKYQKVALDLRLGVTYVSPGRYFNEMSDALQKLLYTQEYLQVGGQFGLIARAAQYVALKVDLGYYYQTSHLLTDESIGLALPCSPGLPSGECPMNTVNLDNVNHEINPNFDFRYDLPGRRFGIQNSTTLTLTATAMVNF